VLTIVQLMMVAFPSLSAPIPPPHGVALSEPVGLIVLPLIRQLTSRTSPALLTAMPPPWPARFPVM
jgi:hypothetical protein